LKALGSEKRKVDRRVLAALALIALVALAAGVYYGIGGDAGKSETACSAPSKARAAVLGPLARGEIAALAVNPRLPPQMSFKSADGQQLTLANFKGRALALNLWATWCVPCRAEMPALDRLEAKAGGPGFEVVAVNVDTARLERPAAFLNEIGVKSLKRYADPSGDAFESLRLAGVALGLPTTLLIDAQGCALGVVAGPANWDSQDALAAVKALGGA
jgi:thiol-disulfide isomerase/thioredoxin